jgi:tetratricopeptide (TPR) repeat protein
MNRMLFMVSVTLIVLSGMLVCTSLDTRLVVHAEKSSVKASGDSDAMSCQECHPNFYTSWSISFHGLSIQPYIRDHAVNKLTPLIKDITIGNNRYTADLRGIDGYIVEKGNWPWETTKYKIEYIMGGKSVFYFLTLVEKKRLQILPLAYDVRTKAWFDITVNGLVHAKDKHTDWKDSNYTFSTACYSCHVSQLSSSYDLKADRYVTALSSSGINCDTCHGLSSEHSGIFQQAALAGMKPKALKILSFKGLTSERINSACAPCHARMSPITTTYVPGESFFDHYDLTTLEDPDFYPDGRDLGENYTYTRWLMSPCVKSGQLHCLKCHTGSGSFRFTDTATANNACLPCHAKYVQNTAEHTHHKPDSRGSMCISCHMPKTAIARMNRSDHSMLPPMPAATITFKSPNACTSCHTNKDAPWADKNVRKWHKDDYQAPFLKRSALIDAARRLDWSKLSDMLSYIQSKDRDEVFAASLIRMLSKCSDLDKIPVFTNALGDPSPLVRSSAAEALSGVKTPKVIQALLAATSDPVRLVRIKAASVLARYPAKDLAESGATNLSGATGEYLASMLVQPDQWTSHYNMGNYFLDRGENNDALLAYETAIRIAPKAVPPYVKSSLAFARLKNMARSEVWVNKALHIDPNNAAANYQKGLLKIDQGDEKTAEESFRIALNNDPSMASAAYNLSIVLSKERLNEAVAWGRKAYLMQPDTEYGYSLASLMKKDGDWDGALEVLRQVIASDRAFADAYLLMGEIYENRGKKREARAIYQQGLAADGLLEKGRNQIARRLNSLQ